MAIPTVSELSSYIYSFRLMRWFLASELVVLESDDPNIDYALHVPSGLVLMSDSCIWGA